MEIEYTLTEEDLRAFLRRVVWSSPQACRMIAVVAAALAAGLLLAYFNPARRTGYLALAAAMAYVLYLCWRADARQLRVLRRNRDTRLLLGPQRLALTPTGIDWSGGLCETSYVWQAVEEIDEAPAYLTFFLSGVRGYVVPRRAFDSEADYVRFVETAKRLLRESADARANETRQTGAARS